jgi:hypothetical protein
LPVKGFVCLTLVFAVRFIFIPTFAALEFVANVNCSLPFELRLLVSWRFCSAELLYCAFLVGIVWALNVYIRLSLFAFS